MIAAGVYNQWKEASDRRRRDIINAATKIAAQQARGWPQEWDRGITVRSSATDETLSERGSNQSIELAADYDGPMISRAVVQIFQQFLGDGAQGSMAIVVQARVPHLALGHMSNEQRVSKTINQWMWEHEPAERPGGRFNSQRDIAPDVDTALTPASGKSQALASLFRKVGRWCTNLQAGRTHLEWGATAKNLWLFQLDFEDDQPDAGVDPTAFLRTGDIRPPGPLPTGSPFRVAPQDGSCGWRKIDKVCDFIDGAGDGNYPTLIFITGDVFLESRASGHDIAADLKAFAHDRIVCRTDCRDEKIAKLNLPRTHTVSSSEAANFIETTISNYVGKGVEAKDLCFILHKFIPSVTAVWAVARHDDQVVRVDSLWGLPDGLQYLPHDTFEYDIKRHRQSAERTRYKHAFLQETDTGKWEVVRVMRRATRWRSLPLPDLAEVAARTHEIAQRTSSDIQIMWFCQVPEETGLLRNIPWFSMKPTDHDKQTASVSPLKRRFVVRSLTDLDAAAALPKSQFLMQLDPDDPELFRSQEFLEKITSTARDHDFPVGLTGSVLGHAFYVLEKAGLLVVALNEPTRSRTRQRRIFRKLVRDDLPDKISEGGETVTLAEIAKEESRAALVVKLLEESYELLAADTPQDVVAELADVLEVVRSLAHATGVEWSDVEAVADQKRETRGGFERSVVLLETSTPGWLASTRQAHRFTIPLSKLGQISEERGSITVPFPLLLAGGAKPTITLDNGIEFTVTMDGNGVTISPAEDVPNSEEQMDLDL